jgi:hypothetical protein
MANGEQLYMATAFCSAPEFAPRQGVVYIVTDLTEEQKDALVAREAENNPDYWVRVDYQ